MPYPLSPDRQYYWDGARWVSAVTPDGAWRFDGTAWRPAAGRPRANDRVSAIVAVGVVAALLLAGLAVFGVVHFVQSSLQSQFVPSCSANATAGADVAEGDTICGYRLGAAQVTADCTPFSRVPDGLAAWRRDAPGSDAVSTEVTADASGCALEAAPGSSVWLQTAKAQPPDVIVVADYIPGTDWGLLGVDVACTKAGCVILAIDPAGVYRIDEARSATDSRNIARGALPLATISRLGQPNRLVVRYLGHDIAVFLNGYFVVRTTTELLHSPGGVSFYLDDHIGSQWAAAHVRKLDVFVPG
jgi:hypothetical protein